MFDHFKPKYHKYHKASYITENSKSIGLHGDNPRDKFNDNTQVFNNTILNYNDNFSIGQGTTKTTNHIPGYAGFIPKNQQAAHQTSEADPFIKYSKSNHSLNYKLRLPRYGGYVSNNPLNIKGEPRPFCLTARDEKFN